MAPIRVATMADEAAVTRVLTASYTALLAGHYPTNILVAALPMMIKASPRLLACGTYYLIEAEGGDVASVGGWTFARPDTGEVLPGAAHWRHFGTHPAFLRRGLGARLVRYCLDEAKTHGAVRVYCESTLPAEAFYTALGLRRLAMIDVALTGGATIPAVSMMIDL